MLEPRRQELLKILGVDQYQRRSVASQKVVEASPVEEQPLPELSPEPSRADTVAESAPVFESEPASAAPEAKAKSDKTQQKPMRLLWWQHDDLLFVEEFSSTAHQDLSRLAQNIATALGRSPGFNGELNWPPAGDFSAISREDFLKHFVRGRSESVEELKLLLTSELLMECAANLGKTYPIQSLRAMLADPSFKSQTWLTLKELRR